MGNILTQRDQHFCAIIRQKLLDSGDRHLELIAAMNNESLLKLRDLVRSGEADSIRSANK